MDSDFYVLYNNDIKIKDIEYLFECIAQPKFPDDPYNEEFSFVSYQKNVTLRMTCCLGCGKCEFELKENSGITLSFVVENLTHIYRQTDCLYFYEQNKKIMTLTFGENFKIDIHEKING